MISDSLKQSLGALTNTFNPDILLSSSTQLDNKDLIRNFLIKLSVELLSSMSSCPKLSNSTITPAVCALTWCNTANTSLQIDCGLKDREHITFKVYINGKEWSEFTTKDNEIFLAALEAINACGFQATEDAENIAKYAPIGAIEYMEQDILEYPALVDYNLPKDVYTNRSKYLAGKLKVKHFLKPTTADCILDAIAIAAVLSQNKNDFISIVQFYLWDDQTCGWEISQARELVARTRYCHFSQTDKGYTFTLKDGIDSIYRDRKNNLPKRIKEAVDAEGGFINIEHSSADLKSFILDLFRSNLANTLVVYSYNTSDSSYYIKDLETLPLLAEVGSDGYNLLSLNTVYTSHEDLKELFGPELLNAPLQSDTCDEQPTLNTLIDDHKQRLKLDYWTDNIDSDLFTYSSFLLEPAPLFTRCASAQDLSGIATSERIAILDSTYYDLKEQLERTAYRMGKDVSDVLNNAFYLVLLRRTADLFRLYLGYTCPPEIKDLDDKTAWDLPCAERNLRYWYKTLADTITRLRENWYSLWHENDPDYVVPFCLDPEAANRTMQRLLEKAKKSIAELTEDPGIELMDKIMLARGHLLRARRYVLSWRLSLNSLEADPTDDLATDFVNICKNYGYAIRPEHLSPYMGHDDDCCTLFTCGPSPYGPPESAVYANYITLILGRQLLTLSKPLPENPELKAFLMEQSEPESKSEPKPADDLARKLDSLCIDGTSYFN